MRHTLLVSLSCICIWLCAAPGQAQPKPAPTPQAAVKFGFDEVSGWLLAAAELVPPDKYAYKPVGTVRSFGELVAHAADGMNWNCGSAKAAKDVAWSDAVEKSKAGTGKAAVISALKQASSGCTAAHAMPTARFHQLMANVAHLNLHYGNAITYLRMLGLTPPSS
jgi:hypothetical protein